MSANDLVSPECAGVALDAAAFRREVLQGLSRPKKTLPCKYLYDERGAQLFERICDLDEYYPTRTELQILRQNIGEITSLLGSEANLVDLGSGSGLKTRMLLEHLDQPASCRLVDVSHKQLLECSDHLSRDFPGLAVEPICADYTREMDLPPPPGSGRTTLFFPGSTIGNFEPDDAGLFLCRLRRLCGSTGGLLVGVDLKKSPRILIPAYNDALGVTAQFNLNLLARINRELGARFDLAQFRHQAMYNARAGRIEMHLVSRRRQNAVVDGRCFHFNEAESVVTEHSYKYTLKEFSQLAARAGFSVLRSWTDRRNWFSVQYLRPHASLSSQIPVSRCSVG